MVEFKILKAHSKTSIARGIEVDTSLGNGVMNESFLLAIDSEMSMGRVPTDFT